MATAPEPLGSIDKTAGYTPVTTGNTIDMRLASVLSNLFSILTVVSALAFLFYFLLGTITWITSAGDPEKIKQAHSTLVNAVIGLTITAIAYPVIYIIGQVLGIPILDPLELINNLFFS